MGNSLRKRYIMQLSSVGADYGSFEMLEGREGEELVMELFDEETREIINCRVIVSKTPEEGYDELILEGIGGVRVEGRWYVKIIDNIEEEEEESVTVFQSAKLSERRGYMLRSLAEEQKEERKKEIMTTELEERKREKKQVTESILKKKRSD